MSLINGEKDGRINEQAATIRLLTDLTQAGSWVINFAPDGSLASVQWGDGLRRLMGYSDQSDFPNEFESFVRGIYPEDRDAFIAETTASVFDKNIMSTAGNDFRFCKKDGSVRWFRSRGLLTRDPEGRPIQYRGVTIDITHEKEHDALYTALHNEAASLNTIHEMLGSGKWTMDFDEAGRMIRVTWSDEFRRMVGEEFSFAKTVAQVNTIISGQCRDKGIAYECRVNGTVDDYYIGDDVKLREVLINILGNAVKFTPTGAPSRLL